MQLATGSLDLSKRPDRAAWLLCALSCAAYLALFLAQLNDFPIYFFSDEAIHPIEFQRLRQNHWKALEEPNEVLPAYFRNVLKYNLSLSVYAHGIFELLAGRSVETVRTLSVLGCFSSVLALALLLRAAGWREWWLAILAFACAPGWFLHARTGFEATLMASCYGWFLYFYHRYRTGQLASILPAMLFGAGTFYSYSNGQGLMLVTAVLLFTLDAKWHWQHRNWAGLGMAFAIVLFLPYVRFRLQHPKMMEEHLSDINTYLNEPGLSLLTRIQLYLHHYFSAMSPRFWFSPGVESVVRHDPVGFGHVYWLLLPPAVLGLAVAWLRRRQAWVPLLAAAWVAGPVTAALAGIGLNRVLCMLFPLIALAVVGLSWLGEWMQSRAAHLAYRGGLAALFLTTAAMLQAEILARAPTYSHDYSLHGHQWGAQAIFRDSLPRWAARFPKAQLMVTHAWANNADIFAPFFGFSRYEGQPQRYVRFLSLEQMISSGDYNVRPEDVVVLTKEEYRDIPKHPGIERFTILERIRYPDSSVGFYVGHLVRRPDFEAVELRARQASAQVLSGELNLGGVPAKVSLRGVEGGTTLEAFFTGQGGGVARCVQGIPLDARIEFPGPQPVRSVEIVHWDAGVVKLKCRATCRGEEVSTFANERNFERAETRRQTWDLGGKEVDTIEVQASSHAIDLVHLRGVVVTLMPPKQP